MRAVIYHNPKCSKSRAALEYLEKHNIDTNVKLYLDKGITRAELYDILELTNCRVIDIIRVEEQIFLDKYSTLGCLSSKESFISAIVENPILLQRPIILFREKGIGAIVRSEESLLGLLQQVGIPLDINIEMDKKDKETEQTRL